MKWLNSVKRNKWSLLRNYLSRKVITWSKRKQVLKQMTRWTHKWRAKDFQTAHQRQLWKPGKHHLFSKPNYFPWTKRSQSLDKSTGSWKKPLYDPDGAFSREHLQPSSLGMGYCFIWDRKVSTSLPSDLLLGCQAFFLCSQTWNFQ